MYDAPDPIGPTLLAATSVALSARLGRLQPHQVEVMRARASDLPEADRLRQAVALFATHYGVHRRDQAALLSLGEELDRGIARALARDLPDHSRSDIHG